MANRCVLRSADNRRFRLVINREADDTSKRSEGMSGLARNEIILRTQTDVSLVVLINGRLMFP